MSFIHSLILSVVLAGLAGLPSLAPAPRAPVRLQPAASLVGQHWNGAHPNGAAP